MWGTRHPPLASAVCEGGHSGTVKQTQGQVSAPYQPSPRMRPSMEWLHGWSSLWRPCRLLALSVAEAPGAGAAVTRSPRPLGSCRRPRPPFAEPGSLVPLQALTVCSDCEAGCSFSMPSPPLTLSAHPGGKAEIYFFLIFEKSHLPSVSGQELSSALLNHFPVPWGLDFRKHKLRRFHPCISLSYSHPCARSKGPTNFLNVKKRQKEIQEGKKICCYLKIFFCHNIM